MKSFLHFFATGHKPIVADIVVEAKMFPQRDVPSPEQKEMSVCCGDTQIIDKVRWLKNPNRESGRAWGLCKIERSSVGQHVVF